MKTMFSFTDDLTFAQVYLERAEHTIGAVVEDYFEDLTARRDDTAFNEARIMAEIGRECLIDLRQALNSMSAAIADAGHPDPIKQIDRLLNEKRRSGKGDAVGALIDKYGVTYLKDLTLGAARELETELLAL